MIQLPTYSATRYVQPLREGGSLPAVVDTAGGLFVAKFRGAGQGAKALIAELIVGLLARALGLPVPDIALIEVDPSFGRTEPDPEIQDILRSSHGINVGLRYLDGAFNFDGYAAGALIDGRFAADLVWLDAFLTNPDRTHRNPNLLIWQRTPWLIDHGAALYVHHDWATLDDERMRTPFPMIRDHVLLADADNIAAADEKLGARFAGQLVDQVLVAVPDSLLLDPRSKDGFVTADQARERYRDYLLGRLREPRSFVQQAVRAQSERASEPIRRRSARR
jgi:hypothetical protein